MQDSRKYARSLAILCGLTLLLTGMVPLSPRTAEADTKVIEGTTNVEDTKLDQFQSDNNAGGYATTVVRFSEGYGFRTLIRVKNVASELGAGATITACVCSVLCQVNTEDGDVSAYRVFKPWVEGTQSAGSDPPGATWNDWDNDDWEWTTAGCGSADDEGEDNSGDGTGADRKATAEDTENVTTAATWYAWNISTDLAQGWYDGTIEEEGIVLISPSEGNNKFYTTEYTTDPSLCPFWTFTYTTEEPPAEGNPRRNREQRKMLRGEVDEEMDFYVRLDPADWRE